MSTLRHKDPEVDVQGGRIDSIQPSILFGKQIQPTVFFPSSQKKSVRLELRLLETVIPEPTKCARTASSSDIRSPVCFLMLGILSKEARHYPNISR